MSKPNAFNLRSRFVSECKHFTGIQNDCCKAGIEYSSVRDISGPGMARWPCLHMVNRDPATTVCPKRQDKSSEDWDREEAALSEALSRFDESIAAGKCAACGADAEPSRVIGRCRYAACGHRMGQVDTGDEP